MVKGGPARRKERGTVWADVPPPVDMSDFDRDEADDYVPGKPLYSEPTEEDWDDDW